MEVLQILTTERPHENESDIKLLTMMSNNETNKKLADEAFAEFVIRYGNYLWKVCSKVCSKFSQGTSLAEEIYTDTLVEGIYSNADILLSNELVLKGQIKPVLGRIAQNEFYDYFRSNPMEKQHFVSVYELDIKTNDEEFELEKVHEERKPSLNQLILEEGLSLLSDKEKHILYTYLNNPGKKLPKNIMASLCKEYETTSENIRQIKYRAMNKLKNHCTTR